MLSHPPNGGRTPGQIGCVPSCRDTLKTEDFLGVYMIDYPCVSTKKRTGLMVGGRRVRERKLSNSRRRADLGITWKRHIPDACLFWWHFFQKQLGKQNSQMWLRHTRMKPYPMRPTCWKYCFVAVLLVYDIWNGALFCFFNIRVFRTENCPFCLNPRVGENIFLALNG